MNVNSRKIYMMKMRPVYSPLYSTGASRTPNRNTNNIQMKCDKYVHKFIDNRKECTWSSLKCIDGMAKREHKNADPHSRIIRFTLTGAKTKLLVTNIYSIYIFFLFNFVFSLHAEPWLHQQLSTNAKAWIDCWRGAVPVTCSFGHMFIWIGLNFYSLRNTKIIWRWCSVLVVVIWLTMALPLHTNTKISLHKAQCRLVGCCCGSLFLISVGCEAELSYCDGDDVTSRRMLCWLVNWGNSADSHPVVHHLCVVSIAAVCTVIYLQFKNGLKNC